MFLATFAAVLGNFSFGYALVYTSPVIPALEHSWDPDLSLTQPQASWFGVRAMLCAREGQGTRSRARSSVPNLRLLQGPGPPPPSLTLGSRRECGGSEAR